MPTGVKSHMNRDVGLAWPDLCPWLRQRMSDPAYGRINVAPSARAGFHLPSEDTSVSLSVLRGFGESAGWIPLVVISADEITRYAMAVYNEGIVGS